MKGGGNAPLDGDGLLQEAADSTWEGLPAGTVMGHLHFHLNPEEADSFYVNTLGFHIRMAPQPAYSLLVASIITTLPLMHGDAGEKEPLIHVFQELEAIHWFSQKKTIEHPSSNV